MRKIINRKSKEKMNNKIDKEKSLYLSISKEFSKCGDGKESGKVFREELLIPKMKEAIESHYQLVVDLDGGYGYTKSFLNESFGKLVEEYDIVDILRTIKIISNDEPSLCKSILNAIISNDIRARMDEMIVHNTTKGKNYNNMPYCENSAIGIGAPRCSRDCCEFETCHKKYKYDLLKSEEEKISNKKTIKLSTVIKILKKYKSISKKDLFKIVGELLNIDN